MESKVKQVIVRELRRIHRNYDSISKQAEKEAKVAPATFLCAYCGAWVYSGKKSPEKLNMDVPEGITLKFEKHKLDHVSPINGAEGQQDWDSFINDMFCTIENYRVCCDTCHKVKTKIETQLRAKYRNFLKRQKDTQIVLDEWKEHVDYYKNLNKNS